MWFSFQKLVGEVSSASREEKVVDAEENKIQLQNLEGDKATSTVNFFLHKFFLRIFN